MNQTELNLWNELRAAAETVALGVFVGESTFEAEFLLDQKLAESGRPWGPEGRREIHLDLSTRLDDQEWREAHWAAATAASSDEPRRPALRLIRGDRYTG